MNCVIKGQFYNGIVGISWSFSYNSYVKFHGLKIWEPQLGHVIVIFESVL